VSLATADPAREPFSFSATADVAKAFAPAGAPPVTDKRSVLSLLFCAVGCRTSFHLHTKAGKIIRQIKATP